MRGQREDPGAGRPRRRGLPLQTSGVGGTGGTLLVSLEPPPFVRLSRVFSLVASTGPRAAGRLPAGSRAAVCTDWLAVRCLLLRRGRPASRVGGPLEELQDHRSLGLLVLTSDPWLLFDLTPGS